VVVDYCYLVLPIHPVSLKNVLMCQNRETIFFLPFFGKSLEIIIYTCKGEIARIWDYPDLSWLHPQLVLLDPKERF